MRGEGRVLSGYDNYYLDKGWQMRSAMLFVGENLRKNFVILDEQVLLFSVLCQVPGLPFAIK